jgi:hypothetical protein
MLLKGSIAPKPLHIGFCRVHCRLCRGRAAILVVRCLLRHPLRFYQSVPTLGGGGRQLRVGSGGGQVRLGLGELLVQVRGVARRKQFPSLDVSPNIRLPALEVAANPRVDRRPVIGLNSAEQGQLPLSDHALDVGERDRLGLPARPSTA